MLNSGPAAYILGGWQVNGVVAAYTGVPFTVTAPGASLNAPGNQQTADQVGEIKKLGLVGSDGIYYDTIVQGADDPGRFGTTGRNILRHPGIFNTDLSLFKNFRVRERFNVQFRTEAFNVTNHPQFGAANSRSGAFASTDVSNANFLRITNSFGERQLRFGLKVNF